MATEKGHIRVTQGELRPRDTMQIQSRPMQIVEEIGEDGVRRYKLLPQRAIVNDELKQKILLEIAEHGRLGTACRKNGVTMQTIKKHLARDLEFAEAFNEANEAYKDKLIDHHQNLVFEGTERVNYDRNGNIVSSEKIYPVRLIELELKKHDPGYRDKKEVDVNVRGGVMVAPAEVSMDEWEAKFSVPEDLGDIVDAEVVNDIPDDQQED